MRTAEQSTSLPIIGDHCENATCRTGKPAVVEVSGEVEVETGKRVGITLKICEECGRPFLAHHKEHFSASAKVAQ